MLAALGLAGCLGTQPATLQAEKPATLNIVMPPLLVGSEAAFRFSGTPTGLYHAMSWLNEDSEGKGLFPITGNATLTIRTEATKVVDPHGNPSPAIAFRYELKRAGETYELGNEYASPHGGLLAIESLTRVGDGSGRSSIVTGLTWVPGIPDLTGSLLWANRTIREQPSARIGAPTFMGAVPREVAELAWRASVVNETVVLSLQSSDLLTWRRWDDMHVSLDRSCAFPATISIVRGETTLFEATRIECRDGSGDQMALEGADPRNVEPNPALAKLADPRQMVDLAFNKSLTLHEAYRHLQSTKEYESACAEACSVVGLAWGEGARYRDALLPVLEPTREWVLQWVFDLATEAGIASYAVEWAGGETTVRELDRNRIEQREGILYGLDVGSIEGLPILLGKGPVWMDWRLLPGEPGPEARKLSSGLIASYAEFAPGTRLLGETWAYAGSPVAFPVWNEGRLHDVVAPVAWEVPS